MRRGSYYQYALIACGLLTTALLAIFLYREIFPEYRIYQNDFVALEEFRSSYTGEAPPQFVKEVKQIVIEREDKGPPVIDRCISCHVALEIEDYSPTIIARDLNGKIIYEVSGLPKQIENPRYIWKKLDAAIAFSQDTNQKEKWEALKTAHVGEHLYDVTKVLRMHPVIGKETRPFEFHPLENYGCVSCHGGNGRGLVTDRAHGPVFDGEYEREATGFVPEFLEKDPLNDPSFSRVFNSKPGARLLFQTNPLYVGALIQAKCMQCHQSTTEVLEGAKESTDAVIKRKESVLQSLEKAFTAEVKRVKALLQLDLWLGKEGYPKTLAKLESQASDYTLPKEELDAYQAQVKFVKSVKPQQLQSALNQELIEALGSQKTLHEFENSDNFEKTLLANLNSKGSLFEKRAAYDYSAELMKHMQEVSGKIDIPYDENVIGAIKTDVDVLTQNYAQGKALFLSQGCYACHRIAGFSRGGVGPELTHSGESYPWFLKESIVWPQADLKTSTMPNLRLDHEELEALVTYLLAQTGKNLSISGSARQMTLREWEMGRKLPWELPASDKEIQNSQYGMKVFALEGCASCHRLLGYESNVAAPDKKWFENLFPEFILGSQIVKTIEKHREEIDQNITVDAKKEAILEEIDPEALEALYSNFKYALRAKDHESKESALEWKARVRRVLKVFIQTYGLGRVICPKPSWSGVYRSDQWLMEHFKNPTAHVPRSIMPVFPFDESKFYALTKMLDELAKKNVTSEREIRKKEGFNPEAVFHYYCSQCHGELMQGNGPVAEWLYPLPKNLRNQEFLRSLTKERAFQSIKHGVKGTPMPPWGEFGTGKLFDNTIPVLDDEEIKHLVDWMFSTLPGGTLIRSDEQILKWNYEPEDVIRELKEEGSTLKSDLIFDEVPNLGIGPEKNAFFIKEKYHTQENIKAGRRYFLENCAPCHGNEADGSSKRAEAMSDAKPRMLVNLDWIESRDDLRLLRSIKYGVPGTAMTPFGDFTSSLQRLQLVVYIRSLTKDKWNKRTLDDALYKAFDERLEAAFENKDAYERLKKEKEIYESIGKGFLNLKVDHDFFQVYLDTIGNDKKENELLPLINAKIQEEASRANWIKQKNNWIAGMAEIRRIKIQDKDDHKL